MHSVPYVGNLGYHNTIATIRSQYFWPRMKKYVIEHVDRCMECKKLKGEHRHPTRLLQPLPILEWKWEVVWIYFVINLPRTMKQHDSIMVVVDKLTKFSHFILVKLTHKVANIVEIYMKEISSLHGVPKEIVSYRDSKFTSNFWKGLFEGFGTNLNFSISYHPELDGKTEMIIQVIEDMITMYVMDKPSKWEDYLYLVEFTYNIRYQASLKMIPFEALYHRKCNTPMSWDNPADRVVLGPEMLKNMEDEMIKIKQNLKASKERKKRFANKGRVAREIQVGEHVFLKVKPKRRWLKLGSCPKLAARYCGPFEILDRIGLVSYSCIFCIHACA
jgi:hypothetical protein